MTSSVTNLSKNARSSMSLDSPGLTNVFSTPSLHETAPITHQQMTHSVSNPSLASTSTGREVERLASIKNNVSNPNIVIDYHPPYVASRKGGMSRHEAEALIKRDEGKPQKYGIKKLPEPQKIIPRQQGRIHLNGPETIHSMVPLSIKGMRWDAKKRVYDENGNR